jgi:Holliday junction resolvase RusA-like endonuclease
MIQAQAASGFFILQDGVYTAPMLSPGGIRVIGFFVKGSPISIQQPKKGRFSFNHADKALTWQDQIEFSFIGRCKGTLTGPIEVNMQFLFERPKKDAARFWADHESILSNLEDTVIHALTCARAWKDPSQIVHQQSIKRYVLPEEFPGVHVEIALLPQSPELPCPASSRDSEERGFSLGKESRL